MSMQARVDPGRRNREPAATADQAAGSHRPWEARFPADEDVTMVRKYRGEIFNSDLYWIPGMVAVGVPGSDRVSLAHALDDLVAALGAAGNSQGFLMATGDARAAAMLEAVLDERTRLQGRIRVMRMGTAPEGEDETVWLTDKVVARLKQLRADAQTWMRARNQRILEHRSAHRRSSSR